MRRRTAHCSVETGVLQPSRAAVAVVIVIVIVIIADKLSVQYGFRPIRISLWFCDGISLLVVPQCHVVWIADDRIYVEKWY